MKCLRWMPALALLIVSFTRELIKSNMRVAQDALRADPQVSPAILAYPLKLKNVFAVHILAALITLTPGTLALRREQNILYIHTAYFESGDTPQARSEFCQSIFEAFERHLLVLEGRA